MTTNEELLTVDQLAARLGWSPKTVMNKMSGKDAIFQRGVHYDSPRGLPTLFRWSAVLSLYQFSDSSSGLFALSAGGGTKSRGRCETILKKMLTSRERKRIYISICRKS